MKRIADSTAVHITMLARAALGALLLITSALSAGCGQSSPARQLGDDVVATTVVTEDAASTLPAADVGDCIAPLRVVVFQDKTGSAAENRTPQIQVTDLEPVIEHVTRCGGELGLGAIDSQSNTSLARLYVPEPPAPPSRPEQRGTPFQIVQARNRYESQKAEYEATARRHRADAGRRAELFRAEARDLLDLPHDASRTDIWGAISRGGYFLAEPGTWHRHGRLILAVVSDAVDNVRRQSVPLPEGAEIYLINGAPSLGTLTDLKPVRFESFGAAVRYILDSN